MGKKSIYESYVRIQLEAIMIMVLTLTLTLCCLLWSIHKYREATRLTYIHNQGVTLQIFEVTGNEIKIKK
ncbi:hypothetical protein [Telluribacter sp.]|jgi:hypothetical protein|uniref:hypothetical protein n=1 Tax=Telluribacter sp. TaxID=1978767 RepID=UPI002E0E6210|nr:hypothetical protein [Telluribacter sp.]